MKRDITLPQIIEDLKKYPPDAKITVLTLEEVKIVGFVVQKKNGSKQILEITLPKQQTA